MTVVCCPRRRCGAKIRDHQGRTQFCWLSPRCIQTLRKKRSTNAGYRSPRHSSYSALRRFKGVARESSEWRINHHYIKPLTHQLNKRHPLNRITRKELPPNPSTAGSCLGKAFKSRDDLLDSRVPKILALSLSGEQATLLVCLFSLLDGLGNRLLNLEQRTQLSDELHLLYHLLEEVA